MSSFGELFDHGIQTRVNEVLSEGKLPDVVYTETDNLGVQVSDNINKNKREESDH